MDYFEKIKEAIEGRLNWKNCTAFYIGKTNNFEERRINHLQDENDNPRYDYCWELAKGTSAQISELENNLILYYKEKKDNRLDNQNAGSAGNEDATILYVAYAFDDLCYEDLYDDTMPIAENFPIDLNKCNK